MSINNQPSAGLSPTIKGALAVSLLASAWALWSPRGSQVVDTPTGVTQDNTWAGHRATTDPATNDAQGLAQRQPLPTVWPEVVYTLPQRDIFSITPAPAVPAAGPPRLPPPVFAPLPVAVNSTPAALVVPFQYLGRMVAPDGQELSYLTMNDEVIRVKPGDALAHGFKVATIDKQQITLQHEPTGQQVVIAVSAVQ